MLKQAGTHQVTSGNSELDAKIREWLAWDRNGKTAGEVRRLVKQEKFQQLHNMLMTRLRFGTSGIRGRLGAGYNAMNDLVVIQTSQGILKYLEEYNFQMLKSNGIVVGYDGRHGSKRFAELTAAIFIHKSYQVRLFNNVVPAPYVSFAVKKFGSICGIMITASHKPKEYNGYKVYGDNGSLIIYPVDRKIEDHILQNLEPIESSWETTVIIKSDKRTNPLPEVLKSYLEMIKNDIAVEHKDINAKSNLKFTYTPLHGVGYVYFSRAMEVAGLKIIPVEDQKLVDPNFRTVKEPNPQLGQVVMALGMKTADEQESTILISHDPDADRLGVAERPRNEHWKVFTGNEVGALLGWWAIHSYQAGSGYNPKDEFYMITTAVTSKILRTMSKLEGFKFAETLPGFKWIGNKANELINSNKKVIFAFEEAMGYMWNPLVLDKDGIQAGVHLATLAAYLNHHNLTLTSHLDEIYHEYGWHITRNSYLTATDPLAFKRIFRRLRNYEGDNTYAKCIGGVYEIKHVRDLTIGYDSNQPGNKAILPSYSAQQMITFEFMNGLIATVRQSGTESKIRYYMELVAKAKKQGNKEEIERQIKDIELCLVEEFLQPDVNELERPEDEPL